MTTHDLYVSQPRTRPGTCPPPGRPVHLGVRRGPRRLLALYQKGKDKQWDASTRIDWSLEVDKHNVPGLGEESCPIFGSPTSTSSARRTRTRCSGSTSVAWQFSQFLHGEQGAMICSARIVEGVPDLDAKFYASTQTMDEARHAETLRPLPAGRRSDSSTRSTPTCQSLLASPCPTAGGTCPTWACRC